MICTKCKEDKPLTAFNRNRRQPNGHNPVCKTCLSAMRRDRKRRAGERANTSKRYQELSQKYKDMHFAERLQYCLSQDDTLQDALATSQCKFIFRDIASHTVIAPDALEKLSGISIGNIHARFRYIEKKTGRSIIELPNAGIVERVAARDMLT